MKEYTNLEIFQMYRDMINIMRCEGKFDEVTPMEFMTLVTIYDSEKNGEDILAKDIAEITGMKKSALTRVIAGLEFKGFLGRMVPVCNKRTVKLTLTNKGKDFTILGINNVNQKINAIRERFGNDRFNNFFNEMDDLKNVVYEVIKEDK